MEHGGALVREISLRITRRISRLEWDWRLEGIGGETLVSHSVRINPDDPEWERARDLEEFIRLRKVSWRADSEQQLIKRIGLWLTSILLGPISEEIETGQATLVIHLTRRDLHILQLPLELMSIGGVPIWQTEISIRYLIEDADRLERETYPGNPFRLLGIFSLPVGLTVLSLRRERQAIAQIVEQVSDLGRTVEFRPVQYSATEDYLARVIADPAGWDAVHISGHGIPGGIVIESDDGSPRLIGMRRLTGLLSNAKSRLKLVTLSSCSSASVRIDGLAPAGSVEAEASRSPQTMATAVALALGCSVVGMRYTVADADAISLAAAFYKSFLQEGKEVSAALKSAVSHVAVEHGRLGTLFACTPLLITGDPAELTARPAPPAVAASQAHIKPASVPAPAAQLVGRLSEQSQIMRILLGRTRETVALLLGMPGIGKSACAVEAAHLAAIQFGSVAWIDLRAPDFRTVLEQIIRSRPAKRSGTAAAQSASPGTLYVLDGLEVLLSGLGQWTDRQDRELMEEVCAPEGHDRIIITSRCCPESLPDHFAPIMFGPISVEESRILTYEILSSSATDDNRTQGAAGIDRAFIDSYLTLPTGGHPGLLLHSLSKISKLWETLGPDSVSAGTWWRLEDDLQKVATTMAAQGDMRAEKTIADIQQWVEEQISTLPHSMSLIFAVIAYLAESDRLPHIVKGSIPELLERDGITVTLEEIDSTLERIFELGLATADDFIATAVGVGQVNLTDRDNDLYVIHVHPVIAGYASQRIPARLRHDINVAMADTQEKYLHENRQEQNPFAGAMELSSIKYRIRALDWDAVLRLAISFTSRNQSEDASLRMTPVIDEVISNLPDGELRNKAIEVRDALSHMTLLGSQEKMFGNLAAARRAELDVAENLGDSLRCQQIAGNLGHALIALSRYDEAADIAMRRKEYCEAAGVGPWTTLDAEADYLAALSGSRPDAQLLEDIQRRVEQADVLMAPGDSVPGGSLETVDPAWVRRRLFEQGMVVASRIGMPARALEYNRKVQEIILHESGGAVDILKMRINEAQLLHSMGRSEAALDILRLSRDQLSEQRNSEAMLTVLFLQANLESGLGRYDEAMSVTRDAFHLQYGRQEPRVIASLHFNFANYSYGNRQLELATAHRILCCLLRVYGDPANLAEGIDRLYQDMQGGIASLEVPSLAAVCSVIENDLGLDILPFIEESITSDADRMIDKIIALAVAEEAKMITAVRTLLDQYSGLVTKIIAFADEPQYARVSRRAQIDREIMLLLGDSVMNQQLARAIIEVLDGHGEPADSAHADLDPVSQTVLEMIADGTTIGVIDPEIDYGRRCAASLMKKQLRAVSTSELRSAVDRSAELVSALEESKPGLGAGPAGEDEARPSPTRPAHEDQADLNLRPASEMLARARALMASDNLADAARTVELCLYHLEAQLKRFVASLGPGNEGAEAVQAAVNLRNEFLRLAEVAIALDTHQVTQRSLISAIALMRMLDTPLNSGISRCAALIWESCRADGSLGQGREYLELALQGSVEEHGELHPATIYFHDQMAYLLTVIGNLGTAIEHARLAVKNGRSVLGRRHPSVGCYLGRLGLIYRMLGDQRHARQVLSEAVELLEAGSEENREALVEALNALGLLSRDADEQDLAANYFRRALDAVPVVLPESARMRLNISGNLATALWLSGEFDEALQLQLTVLAEKRNTLQPHDTEIAITLGNIGLMYDSSGDVDQAVRYHREALTLLRQRQGDDHPETLRTAFNLGRSLKASGQPEEGHRLLEWIAARKPTGSRGDQYISAAETEIGPKRRRRRWQGG